ncbi:hypothetical protein DL96DRAFT_1815613 [Flagelloscypha sp. PMI_526]|nr:hypothetical protein DL96DRAFT_1815613 [Flagelloscypha sp. PMI_526]
MATPGKARVSGIPGRSGIATPSRSRSSSSTGQAPLSDSDFASRAFAVALKSYDPAHRLTRPLRPFRPDSRVLYPVDLPSVTSKRPPSRSSSRASLSFQVGDDVRIESLGYEGRLQYVGEIDGKPGTWAGVELSGGFHGKGKNDGSVNGKQYFTCPPKCGVFVSFNKLSAATVGSSYRPSSVASSYGGRSTPSVTGRATPSSSLSNAVSYSSAGRTTPSTGRGTPSHLTKSTSSGGPRKSLRAPGPVTPSRISSGSRTNKFSSVGQLSVRPDSTGLGPVSPSSRKSSLSPIRPSVSPFSTPKPASRPSVSAVTPRPRIPSAVAMPPPPSPKTNQDSLPSSSRASRPSSVSSRVASNPFDEATSSEDAHLDHLHARLQALEYENDRLRSASTESMPSTDLDKLDTLQAELEALTLRNNELTQELADMKASHEDQTSRLQDVMSEREDVMSTLAALRESQHADAERYPQLETKLAESDALVASLKASLASLEGQGNENSSVLLEKTGEISRLEKNVSQLTLELENERRERNDLTSLVEELRHAGQETIALYEDKLNLMDRDRYDLEARLESAEGLAHQRHVSPSTAGSVQSMAASAEDIDNETLREQVAHLQSTISSMEDAMLDIRANAERDELILQEKMKRLKDKEEAMRKELQDGRQQVQRMTKFETTSQAKTEEVEGALRETKVALEIARAEVETLRGLLADLGVTETDLNSADSSTLSSTELQRHLAESRENEQAARERLAADDQVEMNILQDLRDVVDNLEATNGRLEASNDRLGREVSALQTALEEKQAEVETLRKKSNRDVAVNNGIHDPPRLSNSLSSSSSTSKEELTGLKHIIQELQKDNRRLESENQGLYSEMDQLREEHKRASADITESRTLPSDQNDAAQLRKKLADLEAKNARTIRALNKEITDLEALVESKIYREACLLPPQGDELEQEVEHLRDKLSRQKKSSKSSIGSTEPKSRPSETRNGIGQKESAVCEICEQPGHDIFSCSLLQDEPTVVPSTSASGEPFCSDCETSGHTADECPHSLDVF